MVDENLTDEQQAEIVRQWLRDNGTFILGGIGLGLLALFGWNQWQEMQIDEAESASAVYADLLAELPDGDPDVTLLLLRELENEHAGSPYLDQARFALAKQALDQNDFEAAAAYLEAIVGAPGTTEMSLIARGRLARVRLHLGLYEPALETLDQVDPNSAFAPRFHEIRGDIYVAMDRLADARYEYEAALSDTRQPPVIDRAYVQAKRDSLGELAADQAAM